MRKLFHRTSKRTDRTSEAQGVMRSLARARSFLVDRKGIAATEFALIAPFMIALWLGSIELSQAVSIDRKVSHASSALADLVTQQSNLTAAEVDDIMDATVAILQPYDVTNLSIEMVGLRINASRDVTVEWSCARNRGRPGVGGSYTVPGTLLQPDTFLVAAQLFYNHTPTTTSVITGSITLSDAFYLRPRRSSTITAPGCV